MRAGKSVRAFVMAGGEGTRLHPLTAPPMHGRHGYALASMGNCICSADVLRRELDRASESGDATPGETIGCDLARDCERFHVSEGGVVVVPRGDFSGPVPLERVA